MPSFARVLGILLIAYIFVSSSNTVYFETHFSLLDRGLIAFTLSLIWRLFFVTEKIIVIPIPLLVLIFAMGISITQFLQWYIAQDFIGMVAIAISSMLLVSAMSMNDISKGLSIGVAIISLWIFGYLVLLSEISFSASGQLIGPFSHWNSLALSLLLGLPAIISIKLSNKLIAFLLKLIFLSLIFWEIVLSDSKTSLICFCIVVTIWFILWVSTKSRTLAIAVGLSAMTLVFVAFVNSGIVLAFLGKNTNLTGRTEIWGSLMSRSSDKFLFGHGWARLFPQDSPVFSQLFTDTGFVAFHSHNDLLQWYVTCGILGLLSIGLVMSLLFIAGIKSFIQNKDLLFILSAIAFAISGITEIASFTSQGWFIMTVIFCCSSIFLEQQSRGRTTKLNFMIYAK